MNAVLLAERRQPVKYCAECGESIAGPETDPHRYNRVKYCPACAAFRKQWSNARAQTTFRRDRKERNRLMREQIRLLLEENAALKEQNAALIRMNQEARGYA